MKNSPRWLMVSALIALLSLTASAAEPVDDYARWLKQHFNISGAAVSLAFDRVGPSADPDGDGLPNLAEYALGLDPQNASSYPAAELVPIEAWGGVSSLALTTTVRANDANLVVIPQVSEDGATWWPYVSPGAGLAPDFNIFAALAADGPALGGMKSARYATLPDSPLKNPQFIRLSIIRYAVAVAAPGVPVQPIQEDPQAAITQAVARAQSAQTAATPAIPGLSFTSQISAAMGAELTSNTIVLRGFQGQIRVTAPEGVTLIVNGRAVGKTALVKAGDRLALRSNTPGTPDAPVSHAISFGGGITAQWKVGGKQAPPVPVPSGSLAGYTPVSASVGQGGDANISLPITVSPGIAGMEPKLSFVYNSGGGNGLLGIGFNLGGLSAISRVPRNLSQDGARGAVRLDRNDRFALDGARLISIKGADGVLREDGENAARYSKEIDDYSRIQSFGAAGTGPLTWKVESKAGLIYTYGSTDATQQVKLAGRPEILAWPVSCIEDHSGNQIWFTYNISDPSSYRITRIDYTCRGSKSNNDTENRVAFAYEDRPDSRSGYLLGSPTALTKRLKTVTAIHDDLRVRRYELAYQPAELSGQSQLRSITEFGQEPTRAGEVELSFPPTYFDWEQNANANLALVSSTSASRLPEMYFSNSPPSFVVQGDFDGDGRMDVMQLDDYGGPSFWIALGQSNGTFDFKKGISDFATSDAVFQSNGNLRTADFNADGKTNLLYVSQDGAKNWVALSRGDKSFEVKRGAQLGAFQNIGFASGYTQILTLDANGDGRTDIVVVFEDGANKPNRVFLATDAGTFAEKDPGASFKELHVTDSRPTYSWILPGDYNGDGLADILHLYFNGNASWLALSNGDGTFSARTAAQLGGLTGRTFAVSFSYMVSGDYNNDGLTDILNFQDENPRQTWLAVCKGDGTFEAPVQFPPSLQGGVDVSNSGGNFTRMFSGDLNGDGLTDAYQIYVPSSALSFFGYGNGNNAFTVLKNGALGVLNNQTFDGGQGSRLLPGDFDGDGRDDILHLRYNTSGSQLFRSNGYDSNRIRRVTNGHGGFSQFDYKPMTDSSVYSKGTAAQYPVINLQAPMYIVDTMTVRNGQDGNPDSNTAGAAETNRVFYDYSDVTVYLDGRGFQQAKMVTETNDVLGIVTKTWYGTKKNGADVTQLSGYPVKIEQSVLATGRLISSTETEWVLHDRSALANHRTYFAFATSTRKKEYEMGNGALTRVVTTLVSPDDGYDELRGNLLRCSEQVSPTGSTTGRHTTTIVNQFGDATNGDAKWFLGRLTRSFVTKIAPGYPETTRVSSFDYDWQGNGQLVKEVIEPDSPALTRVKRYKHDQFGNVVQSAETAWNGLGTPSLNETRIKTTTYGVDGRFIETAVNALGHKEETTYEPMLGRVTHRRGPNHIENDWEFDGFGRPVQEIRADGTKTNSRYLRTTPGQPIKDEAGNTITGPAPARTVYCTIVQSTAAPAQVSWRDVLDREIQQDTVGFDGRVVSARKVYNAEGEMPQVSLPFFAGEAPRYAVMEFDDISRVTKETAPGDRITLTQYEGLKTTVTNPEGQTMSRTVSVTGKLVLSTDANNHDVRYESDGFGLLRKVIDPLNHLTAMQYDARGLRTSIAEPNTGTATTAYNGFGEVILEVASDGTRTSYLHDGLGRRTKRIEPEGITTWQYDFLPGEDSDDGISRRSLGKLLRTQTGDFRQDLTYDYLGRPTEVITRIGTRNFSTTSAYDYTGRPDTITYPTGFAIRNVYSPRAHLAEVRDAVSDQQYWRAEFINARGQLERDVMEGTTATFRTFDPNTGWLRKVQTGDIENGVNTATLQHLEFDFDLIGNLAARRDLIRGLSERFVCDELNRLTETHLTGASSGFADTFHAYDELGNLRARTEAGTLNYGENALLPGFSGPVGPHAVTSLTNRPGGAPDLRYGYTARGNRARVDRLANGRWVNDQRIAYTTANLPATIIAGAAQSRFSYGPDRARYRHVQFAGGQKTLERLYIGSLYEREQRGANVRHVHYIPATGGIVAIRETGEGPGAVAERTLCLHRDHLGSIETISTGNTLRADYLNFDAWGRRRTVKTENGATTLSYTPATTAVPPLTPRGFTGHEMLDNVGLIHMNGRTYDPVTGRFLSADPIVQELHNLQNLNRYTYVVNNPQSFKDPSGFAIDYASSRAIANGALAKYNGSQVPRQKINYSELNSLVFRGAEDSNRYGGSTGITTQLPTVATLPNQQAFTGLLVAGGSAGDAHRAGLHSGRSTNNSRVIDLTVLRDHPLDISLNDILITFAIGLLYGPAVVFEGVAQISSLLGISDFGESLMRTDGDPLLTLNGTGDKRGVAGALFGNNSRFNADLEENPGRIPGALGIATTWVYQLGIGDRVQYEAGMPVHDRWTLPGEDSNALRSIKATLGEVAGIIFKHVWLGDSARDMIGARRIYSDFLQGMYNGATRNIDTYSRDGHN